MKPAERLNPLTLLVCVVAGTGAGLLFQVMRSGRGFAPFSPPYSLPATLIVLSALLALLALRLARLLQEQNRGAINPFHAVRLLAAGRASQFTGALFTGFGIGLLAQLLTRPVGVGVDVWLPMVLTVVGAVLMFCAGWYAETVCRIPPDDDRGTGEEGGDPEPGATGEGVSASRAASPVSRKH